VLPALFVAHGSPMVVVDQSAYAQFLEAAGQRWRPRAVVVFSAHWTVRGQAVQGAPAPGLVYDFSGFPEELYQVHYPALGAPELARDILNRFRAVGVDARWELQRGWDHGVWVVLKRMYPDASVPVVALSVNPHAAPAEQYRIGQALAPLREDDVLIIGSGGTVHNLMNVRWDYDGPPEAWAVRFDDWLHDTLTAWDLDRLFRYRELAPDAGLAVPPWGPEHFAPLVYAMGSADDARSATRLFQDYQMGSLSLACWQFG
jgi:4,5-DOPA dioxygenase extradiol